MNYKSDSYEILSDILLSPNNGGYFPVYELIISNSNGISKYVSFDLDTIIGVWIVLINTIYPKFYWGIGNKNFIFSWADSSYK